jgi:hypothetical protein
MSVQEIHQQLEKLTPEELAEVEKRVRILRVITAPGYAERIAEAHRRMDAGQKFTEEQVEAAMAARRASNNPS